MSFFSSLFGKKSDTSSSAKTAEIIADRSLPSVDWERVETVLDGDSDLLIQLFEIIEKDVLNFVTEYKDGSTIERDVVHGLKGSCANLGFAYLSDNFKLIETAIFENKDIPQGIFAVIETDLAAVRHAIENKK